MVNNSTFRRSLAVSLFTLLFLALSAYPQIPALATKPKPGLVKAAFSIPFADTPSSYYDDGGMAFDDLYAYVATPAGLYRAPTPLGPGSQFQLVGFQGKPVINVYVHQNVLYVLKYAEEMKGGPAVDRSFYKSVDHGATYTAIDNGLEECIGNWCSYLTSTQALFKDNLIYLNAGAGHNLIVSNNGGASWTSLIGTMQHMVCNYQPFELIGTRVVMGGQCLDTGYLQAGTLRPDLMGWTQLPAMFGAAELGGRSVNLVRNKPGTPDVYVGVAGGLMKSTDSGQTFRYVIQHSGGPTFPYIEEILFPSNLPNVIVVGGRDNFRTGPFLAYSKDNGETWYDISARARLFAGPPGESTWFDEIDFISQDPQGRIYAGLRHLDTNTMIILQIRPELPFLR